MYLFQFRDGLLTLLSTFLPQDKVAEFARMTPQELLKATEEAAGDKNLKPWHDKLISLGQEVSKLVQVSFEVCDIIPFISY